MSDCSKQRAAAQIIPQPMLLTQIMEHKMSIIDSCYIRAWYAFNADTINVPNSYEDLQRLEIGKNFIKYYSYFTFSSDSLCTIWKKKHPQAKARPRRLGSGGKYPDHWSGYFPPDPNLRGLAFACGCFFFQIVQRESELKVK